MTRRARIALVCLAVTAGAAGCGATRSSPTRTTRAGTTRASATRAGTTRSSTTGGARAAAAFAWLRPSPAPAGWRLARLPGTAALAYPPSFSAVRSDPGTASAARIERPSGLIAEYLNATPGQGDETLANWASFRPEHNRDEGDRDEQVLASGRNLPFRNGRGSCVIDRYATSRTSYQEIACLVRGPAGRTVIVAAAQTARWAQSAPVLERAVSSFVA